MAANAASSLKTGSNAQNYCILQFAHGVAFAPEAHDNDARVITQNGFVDGNGGVKLRHRVSHLR